MKEAMVARTLLVPGKWYERRGVTNADWKELQGYKEQPLYSRIFAK